MYATQRQMKKRKSKADNAGTPDRNFQFMVTQLTNLYTKSMEYHDTQAAAKLLGIESEYKSHKFWYFRFDTLCLRWFPKLTIYPSACNSYPLVAILI